MSRKEVYFLYTGSSEKEVTQEEYLRTKRSEGYSSELKDFAGRRTSGRIKRRTSGNDQSPDYSSRRSSDDDSVSSSGGFGGGFSNDNSDSGSSGSSDGGFSGGGGDCGGGGADGGF